MINYDDKEAAAHLNHRYLRYPAGWEWHVLQLDKHHHSNSDSMLQEDQTDEYPVTSSNTDYSVSQVREKRDLMRQFPEAANWIDHCYDRTKNNIALQHVEQYGLVVQGTILVQLSEDIKDIAPFHFWLSPAKLITIHNDARLPLRLQNMEHLTSYEQCQSAPEAFFYMIGVLLESLHIGLDQFEEKLAELELAMRERNRKGLLEEIIERRYDLLHFNHLFLPIRELEGIAKEAFMDALTSTQNYMRIQHRFERIDTLLQHYALEIDTLISVDDALSSFRGNEIIRTLTIFTVVCLPASVLGAIWGSNFEWLPFKTNTNGFYYMLGVTFIITLCIVLLLWKRGWTGDILQYNRKQKKHKQAMALNLDNTSSFIQEEAKDEDEPLPSRKLNQRKKKKQARSQAKLPLNTSNEPLPSRKLK